MNVTNDLCNSIFSIRYKLVFLGDVCVGKSSLIKRFLLNTFSDYYDVILLLTMLY